jgi:hypothetical protein
MLFWYNTNCQNSTASSITSACCWVMIPALTYSSSVQTLVAGRRVDFSRGEKTPLPGSMGGSGRVFDHARGADWDSSVTIIGDVYLGRYRLLKVARSGTPLRPCCARPGAARGCLPPWRISAGSNDTAKPLKRPPGIVKAAEGRRPIGGKVRRRMPRAQYRNRHVTEAASLRIGGVHTRDRGS